MQSHDSTALPARTCLVHGAYAGSTCPACSTAVQPPPWQVTDDDAIPGVDDPMTTDTAAMLMRQRDEALADKDTLLREVEPLRAEVRRLYGALERIDKLATAVEEALGDVCTAAAEWRALTLMDPRGNIYEGDDVPGEDRARLEGYLKARAEADLAKHEKVVAGAFAQEVTKHRPDPEAAKTRALAQLRQATWECSQFMHRNDIADYFAGVLNEIESDEP